MAKIDELLLELCPDGVEWKSFSDCCSYIRGITYNKSQESTSDDGVKVLRANNITLSNNSLNFADVKVVDNSVKIKDSQWLKQGDILICAGSGSKEHIGKVAFVPNDLHYTFGGFMGVIRSKCCVQQSYLFHLLKSTIFSDYLNASLNSSTINNLSASIMSNFSFPLPPLPIQQHIVEVLDTFTDAISNLEEELALREKQFEYYREQLFNFDEGEYEWKYLPDISINCDKQRKAVSSKNRNSGIYPYYGASGVVDHVNDYIFDGEYLLISEDGANLCTRVYPIAFSIKGKNWVNNHAHVIKFDNYVLQKFTEIYLNSLDLRPWISTGAQPKLNQDNLNKIRIPVPSLERLQEIVEILDTVEAMIANIKEEIALRTKQYEYYREKLLSFGK